MWTRIHFVVLPGPIYSRILPLIRVTGARTQAVFVTDAIDFLVDIPVD